MKMILSTFCFVRQTCVIYLIHSVVISFESFPTRTEGKHNFFVCATENIIEPFLKTQNLESDTEFKTKCSKY